MTNKTWQSATSGDWTLGSNWGGTAPIGGDSAFITPPGSYVVSIPLATSRFITDLTLAAATLQLDGTLAASGTVTVAAGATLDGTGILASSNATGTLINNGVVGGSAGLLTINSPTLNNQGTLLAVSGGQLYEYATSFANLSGTTLTGGVYEARGSGDLRIYSGTVVDNNATITLNGFAANLRSYLAGNDTPLENTLATVDTAGVLNLLGGRNFAKSSGALLDAGTIRLTGGTLYAGGGITVAATGTIVGFGAVFSTANAGLLQASGGTLTFPQGLTGNGALRTDAGAALVLNEGTYAQSILDNGTVVITKADFGSTSSFTGAITGTGGFLIQGGTASSAPTTLELPAGISNSVTFDSGFGRLLLDAPGNFQGTLTNFRNSSAILLSNITGHTAVLQGNTLVIKEGATTVDTIAFDATSADYSNATFVAKTSILNSNTTITVSGVVACFAEGTRISTERGDIAVEALQLGDAVHSAFGGTAAITWLGHRAVDCARHPRPHDVWPVRVQAGAFSPNHPSRDLLLSPDHSVHVDGRLIPIRYLLNGASIVQEKTAKVTYWHVELPAHDVLLAEGLECESYLDTGNRSAFAGEAVVMAHPDFALQVWQAQSCAPLLTDGPLLAGIRATLLARATELGHATTEVADLHLLVDGAILHPQVAGATIHFKLPAGAADIRLISRSQAPAELLADSTDHRRLGVAIAGIEIDGRAVALSDLDRGWHQPEANLRWTSGNATLPATGAREITLRLAMVARYWQVATPALCQVA